MKSRPHEKILVQCRVHGSCVLDVQEFPHLREYCSMGGVNIQGGEYQAQQCCFPISDKIQMLCSNLKVLLRFLLQEGLIRHGFQAVYLRDGRSYALIMN